MIMNKIGVKEDDIEYFILDVYNRCKDIGLSVENVAVYLQDLLEFSKTSTIIPISRIEDYLREKIEQKTKLEQQIEGLRGANGRFGLGNVRYQESSGLGIATTKNDSF